MMLGVPQVRVLRSTRPLFVASDIPGVDVWFRGTLFLLSYETLLFAVTAKHVLHGIAHDKVLIPAQSRIVGRQMICIGYRGWTTIKSNGNDYEDLAIAVLATGPAARSVRRESFPFDRCSVHCGRQALRPGGPLLLVGYPGQRQLLDYDNHHFQTQAAIIEGEFESPRFNRPDDWVHTMRLAPTSGLDDLGGMSGSPVFGMGSDATWGLAGIAIQGGTGGHIQFIDSGVLLKFIEGAHGSGWATGGP